MKYLSVAEARAMSGLRLALTCQTPGPWGLAARALFDFRSVPFVPVRQDVGAPNEDLLDWTGRRNAPVAVFNEEPAVDGWLEMLNLAERLGSGPSLLPDDPVERALAIGFSAEICGHGGFGWSRRLTMVPEPVEPAEPTEADSLQARMMRQYGSGQLARDRLEARVIGIINGLAEQLRRQREAGSDYLVGDRPGACDIYWACFSNLVAPLSPQDCPGNERLLAMFANRPQALSDALDPILITHRDRIWREHIGLPLDYLPE